MSKVLLAAGYRMAAASLVLGLYACKKDEPPPPLPEPPKPVEAAEAPLELVPEDAGVPPAPPPVKPKSGGSKSGSLKACCTALRQNAESAPEPTKGYMIYAAGVCDMAATQGQDKASAVGIIRAALKGAGMPADCK